MLKIWGRTTSANVHKVVWLCDELGIEYERYDVGGEFGGNDTSEYLAMNPTGRIPTIDDDGFILWESNACVRYLAAKYGEGTLIPVDLQERADADRWMDWQQTTLLPPFVPVFHGMVRTPPEQRDHDKIKTAVVAAAKVFGMLDARLADRNYVTGPNFSIGDIPAGCLVYRWLGMDIDRPSMPSLEAWYRRLTERKPYQTHIMIPIA